MKDSTPTSERWIYTYNNFQLVTRSYYTLPIQNVGLTNSWDNTYDLNGNMTTMVKKNSVGTQHEKWLYTWNPRDQLTKVEKRTPTSLPRWEGSREGENLHPHPSSIIVGEENPLLAKRVYTHTNNDATPDAATDTNYAYDHVGNVYMIFDANGEEEYRFNQDAFGNELNFEGYTGSSWATAAAGIEVPQATRP